MTKVIYCPGCSHVDDITDGSIGGARHMDSPDASRIRATLEADGILDETETVAPDEWEPLLALVTMLTYEGELSMYELSATPFGPIPRDPCPRCSECPLAEVLLTVTVTNEEQKLLLQRCDECGFEPGDAADWEYRVEEMSVGVYHNYCCPECDSVVWADVFDLPDDIFTTYDAELD